MLIATSFGGVRPWRTADATALVKYANNRKVWLNLTDAFPHPYTEASALAFMERVGRENPTTFFAVATQQEAIGGIGISLNQDVYRMTAEMGYWLGEPFWGKGLMTETVSKFTDYALEHFNLLRIHAKPFASNPASCRVLEKAGYSFEGRMRSCVIKEGEVQDQLLYAKVKPGGGCKARLAAVVPPLTDGSSPFAPGQSRSLSRKGSLFATSILPLAV